MTDKELRKMSRLALLELLLEQAEENEQLRARLQDAQPIRSASGQDAAASSDSSDSENAPVDDAAPTDFLLQDVDCAAKELLDAQQEAKERYNEIIEQAKQDAERIIQDAETKAAEMLLSGSAPYSSSEYRKTLTETNAKFDEVFAHMKRKNKM